MSQTSEPILVARGVTRTFGGVTAVNNVDLVVNAGELVGIMGPNGAGKSTLFSLVAGARKPSSGELRVCGKDFTKIGLGDAARHGVGLAHQIPKPFRKLTVRQNVDIASYVLPRSRPERHPVNADESDQCIRTDVLTIILFEDSEAISAPIAIRI